MLHFSECLKVAVVLCCVICGALSIHAHKNGRLLAGKLFPGPHLYAGAAIVVLWATAASLVPAMSKGNEAARTAHITLNSLNLLLFAWQVCFLAMTRIASFCLLQLCNSKRCMLNWKSKRDASFIPGL